MLVNFLRWMRVATREMTIFPNACSLPPHPYPHPPPALAQKNSLWKECEAPPPWKASLFPLPFLHPPHPAPHSPCGNVEMNPRGAPAAHTLFPPRAQPLPKKRSLGFHPGRCLHARGQDCPFQSSSLTHLWSA